MTRSCQATATDGPRKRSIRRKIAANRARGTATSASWNTSSGRGADPGADLDYFWLASVVRPVLLLPAASNGRSWLELLKKACCGFA